MAYTLLWSREKGVVSIGRVQKCDWLWRRWRDEILIGHWVGLGTQYAQYLEIKWNGNPL